MNEIAWRLEVPWIDCGILGSQNLVRVNAYVPSQDAPCLECPWSQEEYALLEQEYLCSAGSGAAYQHICNSALVFVASQICLIAKRQVKNPCLLFFDTRVEIAQVNIDDFCGWIDTNLIACKQCRRQCSMIPFLCFTRGTIRLVPTCRNHGR